MSRPLIPFGERLAAVPTAPPVPDWVAANPKWIAGALERTLAKPTGGWSVALSSRELGAEPRRVRISGRDLVVVRIPDGVLAGPDECPHMGASLAAGRVDEGELVCPWHGLRLGCGARGAWKPVRAHDDGVLVWLRLGGGDSVTETPVVPERPRGAIDAVVRMEARCEPRDVIANRLDPWHGAHYHPYAFAKLSVLEIGEDEITVRVAKRVLGPLCVEVDARFHTTDAQTIVMTIVAGEGAGSVVETHATPIESGRTAVIEANLATSSRKGFAIARSLARVVRPLMIRSARRLWLDDCAYAERLYELRQRERPLSVVPR